MPVKELSLEFFSEKPEIRALANTAVGEYYGYENLDSYPLRLTLAEMKKRYRKELNKKEKM